MLDRRRTRETSIKSERRKGNKAHKARCEEAQSRRAYGDDGKAREKERKDRRRVFFTLRRQTKPIGARQAALGRGNRGSQRLSNLFWGWCHYGHAVLYLHMSCSVFFSPLNSSYSMLESPPKCSDGLYSRPAIILCWSSSFSIVRADIADKSLPVAARS